MQQVKKREKTLTKVRYLAINFLQGLDVSLYLFGSWAREQEYPSSDIDLGIMYDQPLPKGTLTRLRLAFEESTIPFHVEIVDLTKADRDFRNKIIKEAVKWNG